MQGNRKIIIMKNTNRKSLLRQINKEYIVTGLLAALVLATVLFPIRDLDQITTLGNEIQYWGGAMSVLGQDWSYYMDGEALVSYGYSLILVPICMLFENASFAYKAAIILNGFIWMTSYIYSVAVGKKILKKSSPYLVVISCFLIFLLPVYLSSKLLISPVPLLILMFWVCLDLVMRITQFYKTRYFIFLGIISIIMVWLEPMMIAIVLSTILYLGLLVKTERLEENKLLKWVLFVVIGVIIGNIVEQIFLHHVFDMQEFIYNSGLQILLDNLIENFSEYGLIYFIFSVIGKVFSCIINTLSVLIFFFPVVKRVVKNKIIDIETYLSIVLILGFLITSMYWMTDSVNTGDILFNYGMMPVVLGAVLLIAIRELLQMVQWEKLVFCNIIFIFGLTITIDYLFKKGGILKDEINIGIISYIQRKASAVGTFYYCSVIAVIGLLLVVFAIKLLKVQMHWKIINRALLGLIGFIAVIGGINLNFSIAKESVLSEQKEYSSFFQISEIINAAPVSSYYFEDQSQMDLQMPVLQMLSNKKDINYIEKEEYQDKKKFGLIITSNDYSKWKESLGEYEIIYLSNEYILWSDDVDMQRIADNIIKLKEKKAKKINGGRNSSYGENIILSPGTYIAHFDLEIKNYKGKEIGNLLIQDKAGVLQEIPINSQNVELNKRIIIDVPFTSELIMDDVEFKVRGIKGNKIKTYKVSYQKENSQYSIGLNNREDIKELYLFIKEIDQEIGSLGTIEYVDSIHEDTSSNIDYLKSLFEKYEIKKTRDVTLTNTSADYLIFETQGREYYGLLPEYSVLLMNDSYALLAKKYSPQSNITKNNQGFLYSDAYKLDIRAFYTPDKDGKYNWEKAWEIQSGVYNYICDITLIANEEDSDILGEMEIVNSSGRLGNIELNTRMFSQKGTAQCVIPFICEKKINRLRMKLSLSDGVQVEIVPRYIEIKQKEYMLGQEEKTISTISDIVNKCNKKAKILFLTKAADKEEALHSFEYLQNLMPECTFENATYKEIMNEKGDLFIITQGYSTAYWKLVSKYTAVSVAGKYMLWAKSDGKCLLEALENGGTMYTQGEKISPYCIAKVQGKDYDGVLSAALLGSYKIYLDVQITDLKEGDIIEIGMSRNKTSSELKEEKKNLEEKGYDNKEKIEESIETIYYTNTREYDLVEFSDENNLLTTVDLYCPRGTKNIQPVVYSRKGSKVSASITWIELVQ